MGLYRSPPASPGQPWEGARERWAPLPGQGGPSVLPPSHPQAWLTTPSHSRSSPQNSTLLVEGCFCPEGTMNFAPGFDVCVDVCGMPPAPGPLSSPLEAEPGPAPLDSANRLSLLS